MKKITLEGEKIVVWKFGNV